MSEDKLSEWEMREEIKNLLSWGHAHDYDDIIQEAREQGWDALVDHLGKGLTVDDRFMIRLVEELRDKNPYRKQGEA